jgi:hypothetical protein
MNQLLIGFLIFAGLMALTVIIFKLGKYVSDLSDYEDYEVDEGYDEDDYVPVKRAPVTPTEKLLAKQDQAMYGGKIIGEKNLGFQFKNDPSKFEGLAEQLQSLKDEAEELRKEEFFEKVTTKDLRTLIMILKYTSVNTPGITPAEMELARRLVFNELEDRTIEERAISGSVRRLFGEVSN